MNIIRPETLADKFKAAAQREDGMCEFASDLRSNPRLREILWAIQAKSIPDGGLEDFIAIGVDRFPDHFQTRAMMGLKGKQAYTDRELDSIVDPLPRLARYHYPGKSEANILQEDWVQDRVWQHVKQMSVQEIISRNLNCKEGEPCPDVPRRQYLRRMDAAFFQILCMDCAKAFLPGELVRICTDKKARLEGPWYCPNLVAALSDMLDAAAQDAAAKIASTTVAKSVFNAIDFADHSRALVRVDGNTRFGKTEAASARAAAYPGRFRMFAAPAGTNPLSDYFRAIAEALGIDFDFRASRRELGARVEHVMRYSGLGLIIDEAHFLLGSTITRNTCPSRLDWTRLQLVDRRVPVVLLTTPQFDADMARFRRITGYNVDQWEGRIRHRVKLPDKISPQDSLAVVRHKAPEFSPRLHQMIDAAAGVNGNLLANVQAIVDNARWNAERNGRKIPGVDEVKQAIADTVPDAVPREDATRSPAPIRDPSARVTRPAAATMEAPPRRITPVKEMQTL